MNVVDQRLLYAGSVVGVLLKNRRGVGLHILAPTADFDARFFAGRFEGVFHKGGKIGGQIDGEG